MAKFIPTPPRYDEIYYEGVALLDKIARGDNEMIECYRTTCPRHICHFEEPGKESGPFCNDYECTLEKEEYVPPDPDTLTCKDCPERAICKYVDDPYNTDGDCLAYK